LSSNDELVQTLLAAKFCWDKEGSFLPDEFYGVSDQMGLVDHVRNILSNERKKAYMAGFLKGVQEVATETEVVDETINQITAERRYLEWR
jgi:predicted phage-related endonuclease